MALNQGQNCFGAGRRGQRRPLMRPTTPSPLPAGRPIREGSPAPPPATSSRSRCRSQSPLPSPPIWVQTVLNIIRGRTLLPALLVEGAVAEALAAIAAGVCRRWSTVCKPSPPDSGATQTPAGRSSKLGSHRCLEIPTLCSPAGAASKLTLSAELPSSRATYCWWCRALRHSTRLEGPSGGQTASLASSMQIQHAPGRVQTLLVNHNLAPISLPELPRGQLLMSLAPGRHQHPALSDCGWPCQPAILLASRPDHKDQGVTNRSHHEEVA